MRECAESERVELGAVWVPELLDFGLKLDLLVSLNLGAHNLSKQRL